MPVFTCVCLVFNHFYKCMPVFTPVYLCLPGTEVNLLNLLVKFYKWFVINALQLVNVVMRF